MFAISPTDEKWFNFLKNNDYNSFVNFWTPTPWNIKNLKANSKLYFMLKSPIRKIGGFGEFVGYKNMTPEEAWNQFGYRNGRQSKQDFISVIQQYVIKNSKKHYNNIEDISSYQIGCIVLKNCEFWDKENYISLENTNVSFGDQVVTIKYYDEYDSLLSIYSESIYFKLVEEDREKNYHYVNSRVGQGIFKGRLLKAYNNTCCISGEKTPELLEAAHIQDYRTFESHHIQNGLLLRVDLHRLYDNHLLFIDSDYTIKISSILFDTEYGKYNNLNILLPENQFDWPSKCALESRRNQFRE